MNFSPSRCSDPAAPARVCPESSIRELAGELGACACGAVAADEVEADAQKIYHNWIASGEHGTMQYCEKYASVRQDPRLLLPGSKWLIVCAFPYHSGPLPNPRLAIARYALGADYHHVLPEKMQKIADFLTQNYGGETLVAVDTKPLRERYWAQRAGLGFIGRNNQLIVPGVGSYVFIATLLWTGEIRKDRPEEVPSEPQCGICEACIKVCPNGALRPDGSCDARRCISYLTIEHKGPIPSDLDLRGRVYGCDLCQMVCPHNHLTTNPFEQSESRPRADILPEFQPREELLTLDAEALRAHSGRSWRKFLGSSPMLRVPLSRLLLHLPPG